MRTAAKTSPRSWSIRYSGRRAKAFDRLVVALAFIARRDGYLPMRVNGPSPGPADNQYMTIRRRGTVGFDFRRAGHFRRVRHHEVALKTDKQS